MIDHGRTLVHDMHDQPSHYVHEVSVRPGRQPVGGYTYSHGWMKCETQDCPHPGKNGACRRARHNLVLYNLYYKTEPVR